MAMGRWSSARGNVHIDQSETSGGRFAGEQNGVGVADDANVQRFAVGLGDA